MMAYSPGETWLLRSRSGPMTATSSPSYSGLIREYFRMAISPTSNTCGSLTLERPNERIEFLAIPAEGQLHGLGWPGEGLLLKLWGHEGHVDVAVVGLLIDQGNGVTAKVYDFANDHFNTCLMAPSLMSASWSLMKSGRSFSAVSMSSYFQYPLGDTGSPRLTPIISFSPRNWTTSNLTCGNWQAPAAIASFWNCRVQSRQAFTSAGISIR